MQNNSKEKKSILDKFYFKYIELLESEDSDEIRAKKMAEFARVEFNKKLKQSFIKDKEEIFKLAREDIYFPAKGFDILNEVSTNIFTVIKNDDGTFLIDGKLCLNVYEMVCEISGEEYRK